MPTTKQARKMRPDALSGANGRLRVCECGCGKSFVSTRKWHRFYSDECRKRFNKQIKEREVPSDMRATLSRIEFKLDQIINGGSR
ncbi:MAG: hypothetical protein M0R06_14985 [Sphaerochaeta sp.]|nr:hypothetical protein [Sphaerochaeta sp.]